MANEKARGGTAVADPQAEIQEDFADYLVGISHPDFPYENVTCGGVGFPRRTEAVDKDTRTGLTVRIPRNGDIVTLTTDQVRHVRERAAKKIWRKGGHNSILDASDSRYRRDPRDRAFSEFLYMVPIPKGGTVDRYGPVPPPGTGMKG